MSEKKTPSANWNPCWWCGSHALELVPHDMEDSKKQCVICNGCGAVSPGARSGRAAVRKHNAGPTEVMP